MYIRVCVCIPLRWPVVCPRKQRREGSPKCAGRLGEGVLQRGPLRPLYGKRDRLAVPLSNCCVCLSFFSSPFPHPNHSFSMSLPSPLFACTRLSAMFVSSLWHLDSCGGIYFIEMRPRSYHNGSFAAGTLPFPPAEKHREFVNKKNTGGPPPQLVE